MIDAGDDLAALILGAHDDPLRDRDVIVIGPTSETAEQMTSTPPSAVRR